MKTKLRLFIVTMSSIDAHRDTFISNGLGSKLKSNDFKYLVAKTHYLHFYSNKTLKNV